jgi:hypothetical protein
VVALAVAAGLALAALAVFLAVRTRRTPQQSMKGAQMAGFMNRRSKRQEPEVAADRADAPLVLTYGLEAEATDDAPVEAGEREETAARVPSNAPPHEQTVANAPDRVGEHVTAVLQAAEQAAAQLTEQAERQAAEMRNAAERDAASRLEEAEAKAERVQAEAEQARAEALALLEEATATAEADADAHRAKAAEEASRVVAAAERKASSIEAGAVSRNAELRKDTALAEERLRRLVGGLREVADRLDGLLVPRDAPEATAAIDDEADDGEPFASMEPRQPTESTAGVSAR